ncbi:MAG: HNH endonuclease [Gemmatimonadales bacterium]|nr:MAG: HNH endonuclease [Gemmatimonadales bacterium]
MRSEEGSEEGSVPGDDRIGRRRMAVRNTDEGKAAFHGWGGAGSQGEGHGQGQGQGQCATPVPDPFSDPDPLRELEEQILQLSFHLEAAGQRRLAMIAEFDRRRGWELGGHRSAAHWLAARAQLDLFTAREMVRTARALEDLPLTTAAMALGRVTFSQARALTRVATPDSEDELLELSYGKTVAAVERLVRGWRMRTPEDEVAREQARHEARRLAVRPRLDGNCEVRGVLTPEQGALLMRAIDWASDLLYRGGDTGPATRAAKEMTEALLRQAPATETAAAAGRRRADALTLLAEVAMEAAGSPTAAVDATSCGCGCADPSNAEPAGSASDPRPGRPLPISGTSAARYQVVLHVDLETLQRGGDPLGRSELADGIRVSHETSRRVACDAGLVPLVKKLLPDGRTRILEIGRLRRPVSPPLRRALEARDGGCRFPGCGCRYTEAHHIVHWADGGETNLANCILLCRHHHRLLHEGRWSMTLRGEGQPVFHDPRGGTHYDGRWSPPRIPPAVVAELVRGNMRGSVLGAVTGPDDHRMDAAG